MKRKIRSNDLAAEFGAATSLRLMAWALAHKHGNSLSEAYVGVDEFTRQCMRIGREFESWCCVYVDWDVGIDECWPYLLEDKFGAVAIAAAGGECYVRWLGPADWPKIARKLKLPLRYKMPRRKKTKKKKKLKTKSK